MTQSLAQDAIAQSAINHRPTVLIVDDEAAPRAALTQILKQNFNILTAENGGHALAVINDHGVDLITLDLKLPDTSGSEILKEIKRTHREIEVIMVTAYGTLQSAMDCVRHGAAGFLLKPFNASEMLSISLQTSHKKQRLDMLRRAMAEEEALWQPDPASTNAWQALMARYAESGQKRFAGSLQPGNHFAVDPIDLRFAGSEGPSPREPREPRELLCNARRKPAPTPAGRTAAPCAGRTRPRFGFDQRRQQLPSAHKMPTAGVIIPTSARASDGRSDCRRKPSKSLPCIMSAGTAAGIPSHSRKSRSPTWRASSHWHKRSTNSLPNNPAQLRSPSRRRSPSLKNNQAQPSILVWSRCSAGPSAINRLRAKSEHLRQPQRSNSMG